MHTSAITCVRRAVFLARHLSVRCGLSVKIGYLFWASGYWIRRKIFRRRIPFIGGLVVNERCNLNCRHCRVSNRPVAEPTFDEIIGGLHAFRRLGIRSVFLEGGEPFLWREGDRSLEDIVRAARKMGFLAVSIYTNGTLDIETSADTIFVSLDGMREANDRLRGPVFDKVMLNIAHSRHHSIIVNYTINSANRADVPAFCEMTHQNPNLKGVFFYFHTPYYGFDDMFIDAEGRCQVINTLLELKRRGLPVLNSYAALNAAATGKWDRPSNLCRVWERGHLYTCCRTNDRPEVCENCGYLGYTEITQLLRLRPSAILSALKYIPARRIWS